MDYFDIPLPIYNQLLETDYDLSLQSNVIPLLQNIRWADERLWCGAARRKDKTAQADCPNFKNGCCTLNGSAKTLCAFDEPETADIWQRINAYVLTCQQNGWPL